MRIDVAPTADAVVPAELAGVTALVIDVLRASTTIITALANGCDAIVPVAEPLDARRRALATQNGGALVAGERQGEPIPGFDLSNSPVEFQSPRVRAVHEQWREPAELPRLYRGYVRACLWSDVKFEQ